MKIKLKEVTYEITVEQDDLSVRGNAMASGDDKADRECEDEILRRLDAGEVWAWAHVVVTARWNGFEGSDSLGGCSYRDEEEFRACGYFEDMKEVALDRLKAQIPKRALRAKGPEKDGESIVRIVAYVDGKQIDDQSCTVPAIDDISSERLALEIAYFALVQAEDPDLDLAYDNARNAADYQERKAT